MANSLSISTIYIYYSKYYQLYKTTFSQDFLKNQNTGLKKKGGLGHVRNLYTHPNFNGKHQSTRQVTYSP